MQLIVENIAKGFGSNEVFKNVSFMLDKGEKAGLVGSNGSGKTTLLKCLLAPQSVDRGSIKFERGLSIGYVEQGFQGLGQESLWQVLHNSAQKIITLREKLQSLEKQAAESKPGSELEQVLAAYSQAAAEYEHAEGYGLEQRMKRILNGLGFAEEEWKKPAAFFSGGQKTRIMLAAALLQQPDLLLLDEPTNHLDIAMTEWLETYLKEFKGGLLLVSHDRAFLNNVVGRILEIEGGRLQSFKGNYDKYLQQKEVQTASMEAAYAAQQDYIARTEAYIRRFKAGIKSKMARGRQSQLDRLERLETPTNTEEFELSLPPAPECAERVLILEDLSVGYEAKPLLKNINLILRKGEKLALLGANGAGKTTLLKTILGEIPPLKGRTQTGSRVKAGYFSQSYERLDPSCSLVEDFMTEYGCGMAETRNLLGRMLFHGDDVFKEIGTLSGGQKARLVLLKLVLEGANLLVLDEPTNHLDIVAREAVEAALAAYDGTVLLVSHDRYFVNEITDRIWEINGDGIDDFQGNYQYYREEKAKRLRSNMPDEPKDRTEKEKPKPFRESGRKEKPLERRGGPQEREKQLKRVELSIREQEALLGLLEKEMAEPESHADPLNSSRLAREHEEKQKVIESLLEEWTALME